MGHDQISPEFSEIFVFTTVLSSANRRNFIRDSGMTAADVDIRQPTEKILRFLFFLPIYLFI